MKKIGIISWQKDSQYVLSLTYDLKGELVKIPIKNKFNYFLNFLKTLIIIKKKKYDFLILEIPPVYLSYLILFCKKNVIVISHSNIFLLNNWWHQLQRKVLKYLLKKTKGLVIHNEKLLELIKNYPARKLVIEPPPRILEKKFFEKHKENVVRALVVLSFSPDEPIKELISAGKEMKNINFYLTGDYSKFSNYWKFKEIKNIIFTGYLKKEDYEELLASADFVIGLTTRDYTTLQSGYDAVGAEKPFLTSEKEVLKKYFFKGTVFVKNEEEDIKRGIREILEKYEDLKKGIKELKDLKIKNWQESIKILQEIINDC
ncbi:MAG: hypothetical protein RMJ34_01790 [candidate division WOR-3 bacterium]|nr:hypothetical protein [candidate division WOR-3 bacterium]MDW8113651.1 hypothetical protein [candidate division WOR-3 bacterium]